MNTDFAISGVGGIIERTIDGTLHVLLQERRNPDASYENGRLEIPSGNVCAFESVFDALVRKIKEETGLNVVKITGENLSRFYKAKDYETVNFTPFTCSQMLSGGHPIMVMVFICQAEGELLTQSDECKTYKWISVSQLDRMLKTDSKAFSPMHVNILKKYAALYKQIM